MLKSKIVFYSNLIIVLMCFSCINNQKVLEEHNYDIRLDNLFYELGEKINKDYLLLEESSSFKQNFSSNDQLNNQFDEYNAYLSYVDSMSIADNKNIFFIDGQINEEGKIFLEKSDLLVKNLKLEITNKLLLDRINLLLGVDDIKDDKGIYFNYLDYYYNGAPQKTFSYLLKSRKRDVLLIKKSFYNKCKTTFLYCPVSYYISECLVISSG